MTEYWDRQARRYDRVTLLLNARMVEMARVAADTVKGKQDVLEVAAGTGLMTQEIVKAAGHLVATDQSSAMLSVLRHHGEANSNLTIQEADATALPFQDRSFDAVVIGNLLHLLPEPRIALREAQRVLRPGGLLIAPTFCHGQGARAAVVSRLMGLAGFPISTRFNGPDLDALVESVGFTVQDARWFPGLLPLRFVVARTD